MIFGMEPVERQAVLRPQAEAGDLGEPDSGGALRPLPTAATAARQGKHRLGRRRQSLAAPFSS